MLTTMLTRSATPFGLRAARMATPMASTTDQTKA